MSLKSLRLSKKQQAYLEQLYQQNHGHLTKELVVADAQRAKSPLHPLFVWNDRAAAHRQRLDRAGEIIAAVEYAITINHQRVVSVAYVRDPAAPANQSQYRSVQDLRADPAAARLALIEELRRVSAFLQRAQSLAVTLGIVDEIDVMLAQVAHLRVVVEGEATTAVQ